MACQIIKGKRAREGKRAHEGKRANGASGIITSKGEISWIGTTQGKTNLIRIIEVIIISQISRNGRIISVKASIRSII